MKLRNLFQHLTDKWMTTTFGDAIKNDITERGDRCLEEMLEYLQAHGYDPARVPKLVEYVYGRPVGVPAQELGGVMVTLAAHANAVGLDMEMCGIEELIRVQLPENVEKIRLKQQSKRNIHGPLP